MSTTQKKNRHLGQVFEDLCLSRRVMKKAEGTQTLSPRVTLAPGEVPEQRVVSIIEMLRPSLRQLMTRKREKGKDTDTGTTEVKCDRMSMDRSENAGGKHQTKAVLKEIFDELCLSRKAPQEAEVPGELPEEHVTSIIEMLSPTIRQKKRTTSEIQINERIPQYRDQQTIKIIVMSFNEMKPGPSGSDPSTQAKKSSPLSSKGSETSLGSSFILQSNAAEDKGDKTIQLTSPTEEGLEKDPDLCCPRKEVVDSASNTERNSKRKNRRKSKKKKNAKQIRAGWDCAEKTCDEKPGEVIPSEESPTREDIPKHESSKDLKDTLQEEASLLGDNTVNTTFAVFRNTTDWTKTPFTSKDESESIDESVSNVESEPTRGCPSSLKKIQLSRDITDEGASTTDLEVNRLKIVLNTKAMEGGTNNKDDWGSCSFFSQPLELETTPGAEVSPVMEDFDKKPGKDGDTSNTSSLNTATGTMSEASMSSVSYSCCTCHEENQSPIPCFCQSLPFVPSYTPGKPKVYWAITKINVYPDNSRTYEVMPLTGKKPSELPEKSDSVFVLIPPRQGPSVPCKL